MSLKKDIFTFVAGHEYDITIHYLNTLYTGDGDLDGALLIVYGGSPNSDVLFDEFVPGSFGIEFWHNIPICGCPDGECETGVSLRTADLKPTPDQSFDQIQLDATPQALDEPLPPSGAHEVIQDWGSVSFSDRRIRVLRNPNGQGYIVEHFVWCQSWFFWGEWEIKKWERFTKSDFETLYFDATGFNSTTFRNHQIASDMAGSGMVAVRTTQNAGAVAMFILPGPDDAIWAAILSKHGIRRAGAFLEKQIDGVWVRLIGEQLTAATKLVQKEIEASGKIVRIVKSAKVAGVTKKRVWTNQTYAQWHDSIPKRLENNTDDWAVYQKTKCGDYIHDLSGNGAILDADGVSGTAIFEAKYIGNSSTSPYVPGSTAPDFLRQSEKHRFENEMVRASKIATDCENPLESIVVITNDQAAAAYFTEILENLKKVGDVNIPFTVLYSP